MITAPRCYLRIELDGLTSRRVDLLGVHAPHPAVPATGDASDSDCLSESAQNAEWSSGRQEPGGLAIGVLGLTRAPWIPWQHRENQGDSRLPESGSERTSVATSEQRFNNIWATSPIRAASRWAWALALSVMVECPSTVLMPLRSGPAGAHAVGRRAANTLEPARPNACGPH